MKKTYNRIIPILLLFFTVGVWGQEKIDTRIDNWRYWKEKAEQKIIPFNSDDLPKAAIYLNKANAALDSEDIVLINGEDTTQSENSVFVNPIDKQISIISNNSTTGSSVNGTNALFSFDGGINWVGGVDGAGGSNYGDPATAINLTGTTFIGHITSSGGQGVAISTNNGTTWSTNTIASDSNGFLDKNHLWIDNSQTSSYKGNLYSAWTNIGGINNNQIEISSSTSNGNSWSSPISISNNVSAGSHNQGVNIQTGPNGEVYATWAIYDSWPSRERAIGFTHSVNGGISFSPAIRIHNNIQGIRWQPNFPSSLSNPHGKNMRTNSFPSMAVDISGGINNGTIYIVWSNIGTPGVNSGSDVSVYLIKSTNNGSTWSSPIRVNRDAIGNVQYFPWITCDPETGNISVIFYDDRNTGSTDVEAWVANSLDGGNSWDNFRVSDVSFTPSPIPGLAGGYMGDYLGISARGGIVYPVWADNRSGSVLSYTSPYTLNACTDNLLIATNVSSGNEDFQEASNTIEAINVIENGANAEYDAGNQVTLKLGFHARSGSTFRAFIEGCSKTPNSVKQKDSDINYVKASKPKRIEYFKGNKSDIKTYIHPNPTKDIFNVELNDFNLNDFNVHIYSVSRGLVYSNKFRKKNTNSFQVNISNFPSGIYVVKIINTNNNTIYTGKIIKD